MSKKPSLHDTKLKLRRIKAEVDIETEPTFRTSVIMRESQKVALEEMRLKLRREGKSISITEMIRQAIDEWLAKRR